MLLRLHPDRVPLLLSVAPLLISLVLAIACSEESPATEDVTNPATLTITEPLDNFVSTTEQVTIRGTTLPGGEVALEKRLARDKRISADGEGRWESTEKLDEGDNEFTFHVVGSEDTKASITLKFDPSGQSADGTRVTPTSVSTSTAATPLPTSTAAATPDSRLKEVEDYLKSNFGSEGFQTSWYPLIEGVSVEGSLVVVSTGIFNDAEGRSFASPICSAVSGFVFTQDQQLGLSGIQVRAKDGSTLISRTSLAQSC